MGIRIIKTALAAVAAVYAASALELDYATSAALLAVLGLDVTKKRSLKNVSQRFGASLLGLLFGSLIFIVLGFSYWVIGLFILTVYPVLSRARLKDGIVTSTVIVIHVFNQQHVNWDIIWNEIQLLIVGLGSSMLLNFIYMPKADQQLYKLRQQVEEQFSRIFLHIANQLRDEHYVWDGEEFILADRSVQEGRQWARKASENALFRANADWEIYFHMRSNQMESIARLMDIVSQVYQRLPHGELTAEVFEELSENVKERYYTGRAEAKLAELETQFKGMDLPQTRAEFEVRSAILQLCVELTHFLSFAKKEKKQK
ncbi:aromatic acid exporter family protein [Marinicrinis lubricantis]|uniref:Aromatic acid exporter family protein n=1 Tax=Marinicrinis lubricantis TaxID=2086470 RepID=A0ABW1ITL7_9BACL